MPTLDMSPSSLSRVRNQTPSDSFYLPTLDGWRAIAILLVMIHHGEWQLFGSGGLFPSGRLLWMARQGTIGVDIFFGISGFLICTRLLKEWAKFGTIDLRKFYIRRVFRIFPPFVTYLGVVGVLALSGTIVIGLWEYVSCFVFWRNYLPMGQDGLYTRHFWSLSVEEHFYLLWPGLLLILARPKRAARVALGLTALITIWRGLDARYDIVFGRWHLDVAGNFSRSDTRLDGLFVGCWVALIAAEPRSRERLRRAVGPIPWSILLGLLLSIVYVPLKIPVARLWIVLSIPLLLAGTVLRPGTPVGKFLEWGPLRWVGRLSYSLYLWQQLFLIPQPGPRPLGVLQQFPCNWAATLVCAVVSFYVVERPAISIGRKLGDRAGLGRNNAG
jgi:peptidoglycan/LPS O-acetylase OafA/YrhL